MHCLQVMIDVDWFSLLDVDCMALTTGVFAIVWESTSPESAPLPVLSAMLASSKGRPVVPRATTAQWVLIRPPAQRKLSALPAGSRF